MLRRTILVLTVVTGTWLVGGARGQMAPGGGGGFNIDPAMMEQMQQMAQMGQQVMQNMQDSGVDPMQFFQEQMQGGNFDPAAMQQALVDRGLMTNDQLNQMQGVMNNLQQSFQNQGFQGMQGQGNFNTVSTNALLNNIRRQLNVGDAEWTVLLPKIQRVLADLSDVRQNNPTGVSSGLMPNLPMAGNVGGPMGGAAGVGGMAGMAGGMAGAANAANARETPQAKAWRELQQALQDDQTPDAEVKAKLAAWRQLHEGAKSDLDAAQKDLTQYVTLRQEGVLITMGIL
jgi:hypothetical protein